MQETTVEHVENNAAGWNSDGYNYFVCSVVTQLQLPTPKPMHGHTDAKLRTVAQALKN